MTVRRIARLELNRAHDLVRRHAHAAILLLVSAISLFLFAELTEEVLERDTEAFDRAVLLSLRDPADVHSPIGPQWLTKVLIDISSLGDVTILTLVTVASLGFLLLARRYRYFVAVLLLVPSGTMIMLLLKTLIQRQRPDIVPHLVVVTRESFPSGHSMLAAIVYLTLGGLLVLAMRERRLKGYVLFCFAALTLAIGLSRIYLGVHYPTDVAAGWLAGIAWATFLSAVTGIAFEHKPDK